MCMVLSMHKVKSAADLLVWIMNIHIFGTQSTQQRYQKYMRTYLPKSGLLNQLMYFDYLISQIDVRFNAMHIYTVHVKCLTVMKLAYFSCPAKTDFINIMCANWFLQFVEV